MGTNVKASLIAIELGDVVCILEDRSAEEGGPTYYVGIISDPARTGPFPLSINSCANFRCLPWEDYPTNFEEIVCIIPKEIFSQPRDVIEVFLAMQGVEKYENL